MAFAASAPADQKFRIIVAGSKAGPAAKATEALLAGAASAVMDLTASEQGSSYSVQSKDDGCDPTTAEATAKEIVSEGADLVLGHPCAKAALSAAQIYAAAGVLYVATETRHPDLTSKRAGPSIFRLSGRDDSQGFSAARILAQHTASNESVAIVHDRTLFSKTIAGQAEDELKRKKVALITGTIVAGDKEYRKLAEKIKDAKFVFFAGFPIEAGFIMTSLRDAGSNAKLIATDSIATHEFTSSYPEIAKQSYVLLPKPQDGAQAAKMAVRFFDKAARGVVGPFTGERSRRDAIASAFGKVGDESDGVFAVNPRPQMPAQTTFDTNGNANLDSYQPCRWNGETWESVSSIDAGWRSGK